MAGLKSATTKVGTIPASRGQTLDLPIFSPSGYNSNGFNKPQGARTTDAAISTSTLGYVTNVATLQFHRIGMKISGWP